ncbi:hypothetical protein [Streptomyces sp. NPDC007984]
MNLLANQHSTDVGHQVPPAIAEDLPDRFWSALRAVNRPETN